MKEFDYYLGRDLDLPLEKDYITFYVYKKGNVLFKGDIEQLKTFFHVDSLFELKDLGYVTEEIVDKDSYSLAKSKYNSMVASRTQEFKNDLFDIHQVSSDPKSKFYNPKVELLYQKIGEHYGNSLEDIMYYFDEFLELI